MGNGALKSQSEIKVTFMSKGTEIKQDQIEQGGTGGISDAPSDGKLYGRKNAAWSEVVTGSGSGDVVGPSSAVDGHLAVFDGATGKLIKDGGAVPSSGNEWTLVVSDIFSDLSKWTSRLGTWAVSSGVLSQSNTTLDDAHLEYSYAKLDFIDIVAAKADIRFPSSGAVWPAKAGFCLDHMAGSGIRSGEVTIWLTRASDGTLSIMYDLYGTGVGSVNTSKTVAADTWVTFAVKKRANHYYCYIGGEYVGKFVRSDNSTPDTISLVCRKSTADFDNVSGWTMNLPSPW